MAAKIRVWDLPTRFFHWTLAGLVVAAFAAVKVGGAWITWHFYAGYAILTLILFRVVWGFAGGRYARFGAFLYGPRAIVAHVRGAPDRPHAPGHNQLGSLSVFALLIAIGVQASLGLFANDEIASEGPLVRLISRDTSDLLTTLHRLNERVIIALVGLHLAAIAFYTFVRREPLVAAMVHGDKPLPIDRQSTGSADSRDLEPTRDDGGLRLRAAVLLALCAAAVWWIVS
ncbi:MAG: cytochrome b/b6 domain-containing protein [Burkholderiales bacterium]|nr:MAG: cytochrome b/b6 domain-containing protein [Burkholderiales bacterium]